MFNTHLERLSLKLNKANCSNEKFPSPYWDIEVVVLVPFISCLTSSAIVSCFVCVCVCVCVWSNEIKNMSKNVSMKRKKSIGKYKITLCFTLLIIQHLISFHFIQSHIYTTYRSTFNPKWIKLLIGVILRRRCLHGVFNCAMIEPDGRWLLLMMVMVMIMMIV